MLGLGVAGLCFRDEGQVGGVLVLGRLKILRGLLQCLPGAPQGLGAIHPIEADMVGLELVEKCDCLGGGGV